MLVRLSHDVLFFLVGNESPQKFTIHESVIKPRSEFVRLALRGEWKEANDRVITLPDDEPDVFSIYQEWLYSGLIHTRGSEKGLENDPEHELLVKAFVLGEKIIDPEFKDCVLDAIIEKLREDKCINLYLTKLVFDNTPSASPLRRLWMDTYYYFGTPQWIDSNVLGNTVSSEFLIEFSHYQMQKRTSLDPRAKDAMFRTCAYHGHGLRPCWRKE